MWPLCLVALGTAVLLGEEEGGGGREGGRGSSHYLMGVYTFSEVEYLLGL